MTTSEPITVYRSDYQPPAYSITQVSLDIDLQDDHTVVQARLEMQRDSSQSQLLVLDAEDLDIQSVSINGTIVEWTYEGDRLTLPSVSEEAFILETTVHINPAANTQLSGLYQSSSLYCTQCEAEGFRRITPFLDRPDVMACYRVTLHADKETYPILLSNGNRLESADEENGRHRVVWEDPFPKPSYLFAVVAGDLRSHTGLFKTCSDRGIQLEIWVEPENIDKCEHALQSLQKSMQWDEERFAREYDLDLYMIVAVHDFNMGAMENKGLNIFNAKYVLASPETATDDDYENVEAVIAHEYFHNWTGNRVTCRDWFQLTLKEGLTVFRDQQFSADMTSAAVKRIDDVRILRLAQFPEDAGPMSHPIRPEAYIAMDNFYTATVYNKGAEIIRMYQTILGVDGFRKGMDLYFERHDGQAVTCDDFRAAMADANHVNLDQFGLWYSQNGTPTVQVQEHWDAGTFRLTFTQTNGEQTEPLHIPIACGLMDAAGKDIASTVFELTQREQSYVVEGLTDRPVASVLRDFSAPVHIKRDVSRDELAFVMAHDRNAFNRWDAGQQLATTVIYEVMEAIQQKAALKVDPLFINAFARILDDTAIDDSMRALALTLPAERQLIQGMSCIDPDAIHTARVYVREQLAEQLSDDFQHLYQRCAQVDDGIGQQQAHARRSKNCALSYIVHAPTASYDLAVQQFTSARTMTDSKAALALLVDCPDAGIREQALSAFYHKWKKDQLVIDSWFGVQAMSERDSTLTDVRTLLDHKDFSWTNPNRMRALVGTFCMGNHLGFHAQDGAGYELLADAVIRLNAVNPQIAARMASGFNQWQRYDKQRQIAMQQQLQRIAAHDGLCNDVFEIVSRARGEVSA